MILKIMKYHAPFDEKSDCNTVYIEGDTVRYFDVDKTPPPGSPNKDPKGTDFNGTQFVVMKNGKTIDDPFIFDTELREKKVYVYILNDAGKTIGKPIGR